MCFCLIDDWVGVDPLGSGAEGDRIGGGRGLLSMGAFRAGGVKAGCSEWTCTD